MFRKGTVHRLKCFPFLVALSAERSLRSMKSSIRAQLPSMDEGPVYLYEIPIPALHRHCNKSGVTRRSWEFRHNLLNAN